MLEITKSLLSERAPKIVDAFQAPANLSAFEELEKVIGTSLPQHFKSLYLDSDGLNNDHYANLFYGYPFSSIKSILAYLASFGDRRAPIELRYADSEIRPEYTYSKKRIPIGDDRGTTLLCIDLDPSETGLYGQIIMVDYKMGVALKLNDSVQEMVLQFEKDLAADRYTLQEDALADGVHWLQPEREIEPMNWFNSETWNHIKAKI